MTTDRLQLIGAPPSPYTRKMVSVLRYRHIPYNIIWADPRQQLAEMKIETPKPVLLPVFLMPDGDSVKAECDSTPLIRKLEGMYSGRSIIPENPVVRLLDTLLEDYGDEWCTKFMFHYRWHFDADIDNAGTFLPLVHHVSMPDDVHAQMKAFFSKRQIDRLYVVGSNDQTADTIDRSYRRFLAAMNDHLKSQPFMLGGRPGSADFALYGQLTQLIGIDPTPRAIAHECASRVVAWTSWMEDLSGHNPENSGWNSVDEIPDTLKGLLCEIGKTYVPAQLANAGALMAGQEEWQCDIDGSIWRQPTFPYQGKCLKWIREDYRALGASDRETFDSIIAGTGCEALFI